MKTTIFILFFILFYIENICAQDNCAIYRIVLDSVYIKENNGTYFEIPAKGIDPTSNHTSWRKSPRNFFSPHKLYISKELLPFKQSSIQYLVRLIKYNGLKEQSFQNNEQVSFNCNIDSSKYCFVISSQKQMYSLNYDQTDTCLVSGENELLPKQFINFSNILYSKDGNIALLLVDIKSDQRKIRFDYGVILHKIKSRIGYNWVIYKMDGDYTL